MNDDKPIDLDARREATLKKDGANILDQAMEKALLLVKEGYFKASQMCTAGAFPPEQLNMYALVHIFSAQALANMDIALELKALKERVAKLEEEKKVVRIT